MSALTLDEEVAIVQALPMTFHALVIEYTTRCNAKCGMCYQSAGPKGSDLIGKWTLDVDTAARVIRDGIRIAAIAPRCHLTGGEGFINPDMLLQLVEVASRSGYTEVTTTTNGFWARDRKRGGEMAARARQAGMTNLELSWDAWHAPFIPAVSVSNCIEACFDAGIDVNLRILASRAHSYDDALRALRPEAMALASRVTCAPVMPMGRAATAVPIEDVFVQGTLADTCHSQLNLTVNGRGDLSPCCSGLDQLGQPLFGNVKDGPFEDLVAALNRSLLVRMLVFRGIASVLALAAEAGFETTLPFTSICHHCTTLFSDRAFVAAIEQAMAQRRTDGVMQALAVLREQVSA